MCTATMSTILQVPSPSPSPLMVEHQGTSETAPGLRAGEAVACRAC